jgi:hypothetical protein
MVLQKLAIQTTTHSFMKPSGSLRFLKQPDEWFFDSDFSPMPQCPRFPDSAVVSKIKYPPPTLEGTLREPRCIKPWMVLGL